MLSFFPKKKKGVKEASTDRENANVLSFKNITSTIASNIGFVTSPIHLKIKDVFTPEKKVPEEEILKSLQSSTTPFDIYRNIVSVSQSLTDKVAGTVGESLEDFIRNKKNSEFIKKSFQVLIKAKNVSKEQKDDLRRGLHHASYGY